MLLMADDNIRTNQMIQSRIREIRKAKGLTLQQVAERAGTTAQTIGRLETGMRTLSINWVKTIAIALETDPSELLSLPEGGDLTIAGNAATNGVVTLKPSGTFSLRLMASQPIAIEMKENLGVYQKGDTLFFDRAKASNLEAAIGKECLIELESGRTLIARAAPGKNAKQLTLLPLDAQGLMLRDETIVSAAPLIGTWRRAN